MPTQLRIATFNLENLDDKPGQEPTLNERIALMQPQFLRRYADILCLQEVNGQEEPGQPRRLLVLAKLPANTPYAEYHQVSTMTEDGTQVYDERNLVILSRFQILAHHQCRHDFAPAPTTGRSQPGQQKARPGRSHGSDQSCTPGFGWTTPGCWTSSTST